MMKQFLLFLFLIFSSLSISAQEFKWDVNAGYLRAMSKSEREGAFSDPFDPSDPQGSGSKLISKDSENGFFFGVGGEYIFSKNSGILAHLNYAKYADLDLLQVPVLYSYHILPSGLSLQIGPQAGYILNEWYFEDNFNRLEIGIRAGASYIFQEHFFLDLNYVLQLNDQFKENYRSLGYSGKINYLNIGLGYRF